MFQNFTYVKDTEILTVGKNGNILYIVLPEHPEFHVIGTWNLDGGEFCQCDGCRDPQAIYKAITRVAEKVRAVRPDMIVEYSLLFEEALASRKPEDRKMISSAFMISTTRPATG